MQNRVNELEAILSREGISHNSPSKDLASTGTRSSNTVKDVRPPRTSDDPEGATRPTNATLDMLRDLSLEASGGYIGGSSHITMGRLIESIIRPKGSCIDTGQKTSWQHLSPKSADTGAATTTVRAIALNEVPEPIANKLFQGYICHISRRWPLLQSTFASRLHVGRTTLDDPYSVSMLQLIYATGGRFLETTGETGDFFSENHYESALEHLDEILGYHDLRSVHMLLLLAIYSLRSPRGPGAWTYVGLAMRLCIDMGLHRRSHKKGNALEHEMRKRAFWCCYCLDRQVSIILGRPFAISDRDIDCDLPLDIYEAVEDPAAIETALQAAKASPALGTRLPCTDMSSFNHICKLRIIESNIQQSIYRVDKQSAITEAEIEYYIQKLDEWKATMPTQPPETETQRNPSVSIDGYDYYMVYYYKCLRFLLHPVLLASEQFDKRFLLKCADTCGGVCRTYKKLHHVIPVGFSVMGLYSVFLSGLTLLYCTWAAPKEVFSVRTSSDMNACSIVLYIITERWPGAKRYRDAYETVKQAVLESIEDNEFQGRRAILNLRPSLQSTLQTMGDSEEGQGEVSALIADMAGWPDSTAIADSVGTNSSPNSFAAAAEASSQIYAPFSFNPPLDGIFPDLPMPEVMDAMDVQFGRLADMNMPDNDWMLRL